jgi:hypothetical protein
MPMTDYDYTWNKNRLERIYGLSDLTLPQVESMISFEEEESSLSQKYHFSIWEEFDFRKSSFAKFLRPDQLALYEEEIAKSIENTQIHMREKDVEHQKDIVFVQHLIKYHKEVFQQEIGIDFLIQLSHITRGIENKIRYVQNEYADFCKHEKKRVLVEHFRNYRDYAPNLLEFSLLRIELYKLWPEYASFETTFDDATKSIVSVIYEKAASFSENLLACSEQAFGKLENYTNSICLEIYGSRNPAGWEMIKNENMEKKRMLNRLMSLLLVHWNENRGSHNAEEKQ